MNKEEISNITEELIGLQRAYSSTFRVLITEERYKLVQSGVLTNYTYEHTRSPQRV